VWHGAGLQFVVFGLLHGVYISVNHAWRTFGPKSGFPNFAILKHIGSVLLTYLAVLVAQVFFRAPTIDAALSMLSGMVGLHGLGTSADSLSLRQAAAIPLMFLIVWVLPNTQQIMRNYSAVIEKVQAGTLPWLTWRPSLSWALVCSVAGITAMVAMGGTSEFLYFRF
jgi:alginate O-acetyltransferase complex protein AlgI